MKLNDSCKKRIHELQPQLIETVKESCRFASVRDDTPSQYPWGKEIDDCLTHALKTCKDLGFSIGEVNRQVGWCEVGTGDEMIAVLGHLDVVPAGDGWETDPYQPTLVGDKLVARGSMDDKGPLYACLYGIKALVDSNTPLKRRIRVLFGTNEETGSEDIPHYTKSEEIPVAAFSPDGEFPVIFAEKGILNIAIHGKVRKKDGANKLVDIHGGMARNVVPSVAKATIESKDAQSVLQKLLFISKEKGFSLEGRAEGNLIYLTMAGKSAHGSIPECGINAIERLMIVLSTLSFDADTDRFLSFVANHIGEETDGASLGIKMEDSIGKLSLCMGIVETTEDGFTVHTNIRFPVTKKAEDVTIPYERIVEENGFLYTCGEITNPLYHSPEEPLIKLLLDVYHDYRPDGEPIAIGGGTYAKELPNTVAFGPLFPGREDLNHQANEYITLQELEELTEIYAQAIETLANM